MMLPLVVVGCTSKQSVNQCVKPPPPPAWIMQPPPTGEHCWTGIISPSERGWSLCKNNWRSRSILMSSADRVAHIDGQLIQLLWASHALPAEYKCLSNKTEQSIWMFAGFSVLTAFSAPPQILAASTVSSAQFQKRRNDGWWFPFGATAAGLFWTVNVCWAHPVISRASAVAVAFSPLLFPMLFEVRRIVCVENWQP